MANAYRHELVMIIDNSGFDRFIVNKVITNASFAREVIEMSSDSLALAYLKNTTNNGDVPELIFLDINMPQMDGFEFLEHYKSLPEHVKKQSIIMLSSSLSPIDIERANSNPYVVKYMTKPLTKSGLDTLELQ